MKKADFFKNVEGLNITDSPFFVSDGQATGGYNYDYIRTGGIAKTGSHTAINTVADTQLKTLGLGLYNPSSGSKQIVRAAGTKLQLVDISAGTFTNQSEDTLAATTDFLVSGSTQPVVHSMFSTSTAEELWLAGGGMTLPRAYATCSLGVAATLTLGGVVYTAKTTGTNGNAISVAYTTGATAGAEVVSVSGSSISVQIQTGVSTITQVVTAVNASKAAAALVTASGASATVVTAPVSGTFLAGGVSGGTSTAKVTQNGVAAPTGTMTAVNQGISTGGAWGTAVGAYYYAVALRKASTQVISNAALDQLVTIVNATDTSLITFPTGVDSTKYDAWYLYRSSVGGASAFTAGTLVAIVPIATTTFIDTNISRATSQSVPRAGSVSLDNSTLPTGTYNSLVAFKRRLITAKNSTVYISDLDKPESWPTGLTITIPTGGSITGLSVIGYNSPTTGTTDEYLVVFKQREMWVITGTGILDTTSLIYDLELKFVDNIGCVSQPLIVRASGFIAWIDYRGIYMWTGLEKPIYVSRPIEAGFGVNGNIDKTNIIYGSGVFFRKKNQIIWSISDRTKGVNKLQIKLDLRLTSPRLASSLSNNNVSEGVFIFDTSSMPIYSGVTYLPTDNEELMLIGDNAGFIYKAYYGANGAASGVDFSYTSKAFDMNETTVAKRFYKVVVYIDQSTKKDLTLDYWTSYRILDNEKSTIDVSMEAQEGLKASLWDLAKWDQSLWDESSIKIIPLVYNLNSEEGNNEGDSITLKFSQSELNAPVTIHGFSIFWEEISLRK